MRFLRLFFGLFGFADTHSIYLRLLYFRSIGMVPKDAMVPKKNDRATFQKDFHEAFYSYKEKKFKAKQDKKKDTTVASTLAAKTHTRLIKIFSRIVPDGMNLMTAFLHWKDVNFYSKSLVEDGGASYKAHNMSLVDLKIAGVANSVGKSTAKLAVALHADFEAEAEAELIEGKKFSKKEKKEHARKRVAAKVLSEVAKTRDTDLDVVANFIQKNREGIHGVNRWGRGLAGGERRTCCSCLVLVVLSFTNPFFCSVRIEDRQDQRLETHPQEHEERPPRN